MTDADRALIASMVVLVAEDPNSPEVEKALRAMDRALEARDRTAPGPCPGVVSAAGELVRAWQHGGLYQALNRRGYARLALSEYFIPRRDEALKGLSAGSRT